MSKFERFSFDALEENYPVVLLFNAFIDSTYLAPTWIIQKEFIDDFFYARKPVTRIIWHVVMKSNPATYENFILEEFRAKSRRRFEVEVKEDEREFLVFLRCQRIFDPANQGNDTISFQLH